MVMMCSWRSRLIRSIIAASVVDLPEPVGPVTSTNPRGFLVKSSSTGGRPSELERRHLLRDQAEGRADRGALEVGVHAEGLTHQHLDLDSFTLRKAQAEKPHQFFATQFSHVVTPALGKLLRERFLAQVVRYPPEASVAKAVAVIKEPAGSQSADLISSSLPKSRLLFLLRDGRDVVDSGLAANLAGSWVSKEFPGARGDPGVAASRIR